MAELFTPGPGCEERSIREAVCVHTKKIFDACRDKDCIDELRVYLDEKNQSIIDESNSVKAGCAELIHAYIGVEPVHFNRGFYSVEVRYYYRITAEANVCGGHPVPVVGMATFSKRCVLFGSEGYAKVFSSDDVTNRPETAVACAESMPEAVVEVIDPMVLNMKVVDMCEYRPLDNSCADIPKAVADCFDAPLKAGAEIHRLYVTLGQFSMIRLQRDTQLLMPAYDYCVPTKECDCDGGECPKDPCEMFAKVQFPVDSFFPPNEGGKSDGSHCGC